MLLITNNIIRSTNRIEIYKELFRITIHIDTGGLGSWDREQGFISALLNFFIIFHFLFCAIMQKKYQRTYMLSYL